ncbi:hypothetical protein LB543_28010 [Mesorhizobium sp. ESP7-2]|uniref:hypothetical protein n=1 Tax=Mesorhizobium sp. ESP7-2 TaxID=2876622 RepID=UPI001CCB916C|nr:hypothetical protein [Mesorhizobium sp. ESP7-2]MBZ9710547.1 hypothetical protein [Mesorhizobium sp. ESP7-2]
MSGPRDLRRGSKPFERANPTEAIGSKSHFLIERWGVGWAINVHRRGQAVQTIMCKTEGELNRERRRLSDEGLIGINGGAR